MPEKNRLFCSKPFRWFEVCGSYQPKGDVFMCCPGWLETPIGNIQRQSVEEIWNGEKAREIRRSILDGSFTYCNRARCSFLQFISGPVERIGDVKDKELKEIIRDGRTILPYGPREINCSYDDSCNLFCPSCRAKVIIETTHKQEIWEIHKKLEHEAFQDARLLYLTGSGDPFGSPFYRKWIRTMRRESMPHLEKIHIHTNAQLWTRELWNTIPEETRNLVKSTEISIDAASSETYAINRRGGKFEKLLRNLEFVSSLRECGPLRSVTISMVVQKNNFREMSDFVRLGKRFRFDTVYFSQLVNWGTFSNEEFISRAVHRRSHPRHQELRNLLREKEFCDSIVHLGNLTELKEM
jgi:wyosine [tRNA(Phe)-imidazoG37] synthetase (radical SAM superfamily)